MNEEDYASALLAFVRREFVHADEGVRLDETTPLLESGILDSLRIAVLLVFIRDELGAFVPLEKIDAANFKDVRTIAAVLDKASAVGAGPGGRA